MHSSLAPNMEASIESKFSAAFEQQNSHTSSGGMKGGLVNGGSHYHSAHSHGPSAHSTHSHNHHKSRSHPVPPTTTATPNTESGSGEKTVSFRKGNDLESFESLSSLYANNLFTDMVICCSGKMFKCHRVVMAAASLYIRDALSAFYNNAVDGNTGGANGCNNCNTVMILPKEIKVTDMEAILHFIYDGHVEVKVDAIESFLKSARTLNIKGLSNVNIVFNNNGSATDESVEDCSLEESSSTSAARKNNGYSKNSSGGSSNLHHHSNLLNGHAGVTSPPPSPPSINTSLASLKALTGAQSSNQSTPSPHVNGGSAKHLNGIGSAHSGAPFNRGQFSKNRDHHHHQQQLSNLRPNDNHNSHLPNQSSQNHSSSSSSLLSHNLTPAHQSSTPKSIFANGNLFSGGSMRHDAASSIVPNASGGSSSGRRKQKFPTNIPPTAFLNDAIPPLAAALYMNSAAWLHNSENDDEDDDGDDSFEEKKLVIKDDSSNDCNSTGDNLSTASLEVSSSAGKAAAAHHSLGPFNQLPLGNFNPQMPCMIEVEADPTNFPTYCHDQNENVGVNAQQAAVAAAAASLLQTAGGKQRRRHFKSAFPSAAENLFNSAAGVNSSSKKLKLPYGGNVLNSPNSDLSIKPFSPLMAAGALQGAQSSPVDLLAKKVHGSAGSAGALRHVDLEKQPLFSAFSTVKTAAGANPSAGGGGGAAAQSPSSVSSLPGSANWAGNKWKCDICNKYYGNKQTLKEHMDYFHSNREEQIYICNICNKEYTWRKSLMKHYRDIHQMRNTPALAEINRQLAALATNKGRSGGGPGSMASPMSAGSDHSGHGSALQSYVSIANSMNRHHHHHSSGGGKASSVGDESRDNIDCDGEASVDAVPEEEDEEDDSNEEVEIEAGEHSSTGSGHAESPSEDHGDLNGGEEGKGRDAEEDDSENHPMIIDEGAAEKEEKNAAEENGTSGSDHHSDASSATTVPENSSPVSSPPSSSS